MSFSKQLDFVDDDIRDHTSLDSKLYAILRSDSNKEPPIAAVILMFVVSGSPDKLDQKFGNLDTARDIVEQYSLDPDGDDNSNLEKLLGWCWRQGTFEKIRRLSKYGFMILIFLSYVLQPQKYCSQCLRTKLKRSGRKGNGMYNLSLFATKLMFRSSSFNLIQSKTS